MIFEKEIRPWGSFVNLKEEKNYKVKEIVIEPLQRISLQYHNDRSELWMVVFGEIIVNKGLTEYKVIEGGYVYIPSLHIHRIYNPSDANRAVIIEIQHGKRVVEEDIIRLEDDYLRLDKCDKIV